MTRSAKALHGLSRALVNNMVRGVSEGFVKKLEIQGVGFKAAVQGNNVNMSLGYSHPIVYPIPAQIKVTVEENTKITIEGPDRQSVGQVAAELRSFYPPNPTRARACATPMNASSARKARRSSKLTRRDANEL